MIGELKEKGLVWIAKIEFDCAAALAQMEYHGIQLDLAAWRELTARAEEEKGEALEELRRFGGRAAPDDALGPRPTPPERTLTATSKSCRCCGNTESK